MTAITPTTIHRKLHSKKEEHDKVDATLAS